MATFDEAQYDSAIRRQIGIERYKTGVIGDMVKVLREVDRDIVDQIMRLEGSTRRKRLEEVLASIRNINRRAFNELLKRSKSEIEEFAEAEVGFVTRSLNVALPTGIAAAVEFIEPSDRLLFVAARGSFNERLVQGRPIRDWIDGLREADAARIEQAVRLGFVEGEGIDTIVRRVRGTPGLRFKDGTREVTRRQLESLVRTSVQSAASQARDTVYDDNAELIKGVRWISTLDGRTSQICMSLDQKVFPVDSGPRPPGHFQCRSSTVPVIKSWSELGFDQAEPPKAMRPYIKSTTRWRKIPKSERPLIDRGMAPGDEKYGAWLRRQGQDFASDVLGPTKAKLFMKGKLPMEKFIDEGTLRSYTLDELRKREPGAFKRAGL